MSTLDTVPGAARPGLDAWGYLILCEARLVARDTAGLIIPIVLPVLIMAMNGLGMDGDAESIPEFGGLSALEAIVVPLTLVMIVALVGIVNMPSFLASHRKTGVLRRLSTTPANPSMVLVAQVVVSFLQTLLGTALALGIAAAAFDVGAPRDVAAAVGVFALVSAAMYALGMLVGAVAPTTNAAIAIGLLGFFALMALGGGFGGRDNLPETLATLGEWLPYGAGVEALSAAWQGASVDPLHLAVLAGTTVVATGLAVTRFRWSED